MNKSLSSEDYEQVVYELTRGLCESQVSGDLRSLQISYGRKNRVRGASGFSHQIDVSLKDETQLFLIECKCKLRSARKVDVNDVLALVARKIDIQEHYSDLVVCAILVSLDIPTNPANLLAKHFGIEIEVVKSAHDYGMRFGKYVFTGIAERARVTDRIFDTIIRKAS